MQMRLQSVLLVHFTVLQVQAHTEADMDVQWLGTLQNVQSPKGA